MKYLVFAIITALSLAANAELESDYYVDSYDKGSYELYVVTIKGCETYFKVPKKDHAALAKNEQAIREMIALSIKRSKSGCR